MASHRYHGMGLESMVGYNGNPKMFTNVAMVTFFDMEDQKTLIRQRRLAAILTKLPLVAGAIVGLAIMVSTLQTGFDYEILMGRLTTVGISTLVGELVMCGFALYLCRGWFAFTRWVRKYDAHIVSMLMGGQRTPHQLPGYGALLAKIRREDRAPEWPDD